MGHFDTLTRADTLIFSQAPGLNRQIMIQEVKIQHVNPYAKPGKDTHLI
jgi:hypothetical protein